MSVTLTVREIRDLAQYAGLEVDSIALGREELDTELHVEVCPKCGLRDDDGAIIHYRHIAWFVEYPDEGSSGLGDPL